MKLQDFYDFLVREEAYNAFSPNCLLSVIDMM